MTVEEVEKFRQRMVSAGPAKPYSDLRPRAGSFR